ncbi:MAG: T9SS C-terminal target domain-containing protein [Cytophagales bacterium]|nr:MAG: T9SS C-terminal target domain-containing protein [Cytophagales bacterium]
MKHTGEKIIGTMLCALCTYANLVAQPTTIKLSNQIIGESKGIGMNIEFMQTPTWQTSPLMLNKLPFGVFEQDFNSPSGLNSLPEVDTWKFSNGRVSADKTSPFQGLQCMKFVSNGSNGLISCQSQFFFQSTANHVISFAIKAGADFNGTVNIELRNSYFGNLNFLTSPNITLTKDWVVYKYTFKGEINQMMDRVNINVKGAGTVFFDDGKIYTEGDDRGDKFSKHVMEKLKEFSPGLLRWGAIPANFYSFSSSTGLGAPNRFTYGDWFKICQELNAIPDICVGVDYKTDFVDSRDATFKAFAEYFTGDNTTTGGKIRLSEGFTQPLIQNAKELIIELGNEVWGGATHGASFYSLDGQISVDEYMKYADGAVNALNSVSTYANNKNKISVVYSGWSVGPDTWNLGLINRRFKRPGDQIGLSGYLGGNSALPNGVPLTDPTSIDAQREYYKKTIGSIPANSKKARDLQSATVRSQGKNMPFFFYEGTMTNEAYYGRMGQAVVYMDYILEMMREGSLSWGVAFNFTGGQYALVYNDNGQFKNKPMFTLGREFNKNVRGSILSTSVTGPMDSLTTGGIKYPKVGHMITSPDGKSFSMILTSRDFENAQNVKIELPVGKVFSKTATVRTITSPNWNVDKESELNISTTTINDFDSNKLISIPKFGVVIVNFTGNLDLVLNNEERIDYLEKLDVQIYPNPTQRIVNIQGAINPNTKVYNSLGLEVMNSNSNALDFNGLSNGIYNLIIKSDNKITKEKVVLID